MCQPYNVIFKFEVLKTNQIIKKYNYYINSDPNILKRANIYLNIFIYNIYNKGIRDSHSQKIL